MACFILCTHVSLEQKTIREGLIFSVTVRPWPSSLLCIKLTVISRWRIYFLVHDIFPKLVSFALLHFDPMTDMGQMGRIYYNVSGKAVERVFWIFFR